MSVLRPLAGWLVVALAAFSIISCAKSSTAADGKSIPTSDAAYGLDQ